MIIFDTNFTTLNEYIDAERTNKYMAHSIKTVNTDNAFYYAKQSGYKSIENKVDIKITWFTQNNRIDHDNISFAKKFILDGLVKANILKNDSPKYVGNFIDEFKIDKSKDHRYCILEFNES